MTTPEPEPTFAVPLDRLIKFKEWHGPPSWGWYCLLHSGGYSEAPSQAYARSAAIEHLEKVHGIQQA